MLARKWKRSFQIIQGQGQRLRIICALCIECARYKTNLKRVKLENIPVPAKERDAYINSVSSCVRSRARLKLVKVKGLYGTSQQKFIAKAAQALSNIVQCLYGNHSQCQRSSFACTAKMKWHSYKDLPGGRRLALTEVVRRQLNEVISATLSHTVLGKLYSSRKTN